MLVENRDVKAEFPFIKKSALYSKEKPYGSDVYTKEIPRSNIKTDFRRDIPITDLRPMVAKVNMDDEGFQIVNFQASLNGEEWFDQANVESIYCMELGKFMKEHLNASSVQIFEAQVRRRHSSFPHSYVNSAVGFQPAMRPHVDASYEQTKEKIRTLNGDMADHLLAKRWMYFNVWKPLKGPLRDWPLAVCDPRSVCAADDIIEVDNIIKGESAENLVLHWNRNQKWFYLSDHMPNELLLIRQADSDARPGVPHAAFDLRVPEEYVPEPRESVEVRMIAYFDS